MASFAERMAALKAASAPAPVVPAVDPEPITHINQPSAALVGVVAPEPTVVETVVAQPAGINPPSGVPEGQPVLLGEFDPERQSKGPFIQDGNGEWVALKSMKKPDLRDAVKLLAGRVKDAGLGDKFAQHLTAHTLDLKQIAADAKTTVDGLRSTATLLIRVLAGDDETALRRAGVEALPETVAEHRRVAVAIERDGGSRAEALVKLLKDGRSEEFVRLVNVAFEAPLSEDLLVRTIAVVPQPVAKAVGEVSPEDAMEVSGDYECGEIDYAQLKTNDPPAGIAAFINDLGQDNQHEEITGTLFHYTEIKDADYLLEEGRQYALRVNPQASVPALLQHLQAVNEKYASPQLSKEEVLAIAKAVLYPAFEDAPKVQAAPFTPEQEARNEEFDLDISIKSMDEGVATAAYAARDHILEGVYPDKVFEYLRHAGLHKNLTDGELRAACDWGIRCAAHMRPNKVEAPVTPEYDGPCMTARVNPSLGSGLAAQTLYEYRLNNPPRGIKYTLDLLAATPEAQQSPDSVTDAAKDIAGRSDTSYLAEEAIGWFRLIPQAPLSHVVEHLVAIQPNYCLGPVSKTAALDIASKVYKDFKRSRGEEPTELQGDQSFEERIKTLEKAASWAMHEKKDVYEHLVTINKTFPNPLADNAVRSVVASLEVNTTTSANDAVKLVDAFKAATELAPCTIHGKHAPILAVGCEIAGPLLMQDFEGILTCEFEPKIAKKTGAAYGQAAYSEDYKLMAALVEHYGKKAFAEHSGGVMTLNSFRRDRQYILDGLARAGWIILNGRG